MRKISDSSWMVSGLIWWTERLLGLPALAHLTARIEADEMIRYIRQAEDSGRLKRQKRQGVWVWDWGREIDFRMQGRRDPESFWKEKWDGKWRLFSFELPARKKQTRLQLLRTLKSLGFGRLQDSLWVSPRKDESIKELLDSIDVAADELSIFEARSIRGRDDAGIVQSSWNWSRIGDAYDEYQAQLDRLQVNLKDSMTLKEAGELIRADARHWLAAISLDPLLPQPLDAEGNDGPEIWAKRKEFIAQTLNAAGLKKHQK